MFPAEECETCAGHITLAERAAASSDRSTNSAPCVLWGLPLHPDPEKTKQTEEGEGEEEGWYLLP